MVVESRLLVLIIFVRISMQHVIHVLIEYFKLVHKAFIPTHKLFYFDILWPGFGNGTEKIFPVVILTIFLPNGSCYNLNPAQY